MRIQTMSSAHEKIYGTDDLSRIPLADYIHDMVNRVMMTLNIPCERLDLHLDILPMGFNLSIMIPLALILNELIIISLQNCRETDAAINLNITMEEVQGYIELQYSLEDEKLINTFREEKMNILGIQIIEGMIQQLEGTMKIIDRKLTNVIIRFPKDQE